MAITELTQPFKAAYRAAAAEVPSRRNRHWRVAIHRAMKASVEPADVMPGACRGAFFVRTTDALKAWHEAGNMIRLVRATG